MRSTKPTKTRKKAPGVTTSRQPPRDDEERLPGMLDISAGWYWEQDQNFRYNRIAGAGLERAGFDEADFLGTTPWERDSQPLGGGDWAGHKAALKEHQPFADFILKRPNWRGELRYIESSGQPVFNEQGQFRGYRGVARDVTGLVQMKLRLAIEHGVTQILAESNNIAETAPRVIRLICETLDWACGARWEPCEGGDALRCTETWGIDSPDIDAFLDVTRRRPPSTKLGGLSRRAWREQKPTWIRDVTREPTFHRAPAALKAGLHSAFAFPIKAGAQMIGAMEFFNRENHQPDAELLDCTNYIGSQIGQFIQRTRAEEERRESEARFRSLTALSSDFFWETDSEHRMVHVHYGPSHRPVVKDGERLAKTRWEIPSTYPDAAGWAAHRATLEAHLPFHDFEFARIDADAVERYLSISGEPILDAAGRFKGYRGVGKDITVRKREEQLLKLEHTVTRALAEAVSVAGALKEVMRAVCETKGWECGRYFRMDDKAGVFRFAESWYVPTPELDRYIAYSREKTFAPDVGIVGKAGAGEPQWVTDVSRDARVVFPMMASEHGMRGAFMFAAKSGGKALGVLSFTSREIREPDERLLQAVRVIGSQIGQFLQRKQAEEVLRESEERFRSLTELSSDWYWEQDENQRFTRFSGRGLDAADIYATGMIGKTRWETPGLIVDAAAQAAVQAKLDAREPFYDLEYQRVEPSGSTRCIITSGMPMFDAAGRFTGYRGVAKDITARRRGEQLLALEHAVNRCLADATSISEGIKASMRAVCETEHWLCGRFLRVDDQAGTLRFGEAWSAPDAKIERFIEDSRAIVYGPGVGLVGHVWQSGEPMWVPDITQDERVARPARAQKVGLRGAFVVPVPAEGKIIGVLIFHSRQLRAPDERLLQAMQVIGSQIGQFLQRKQAEDGIRESEERFRAIVDSANDGILVYDRALRVIQGNAAAERIIGLPLADIAGASGFTSLLPCIREDGSPFRPEDRPTRNTVRLGKPLTGQIIGIKRADGSVTWLSVNTGFLRRSGESDYYGVVSTLADITGQREAEGALRKSEERFRNLTELSSDWFWEQDAEGRFTRLEGRHVSGDNGAFKSELGKTYEELGVEIEGGWDAHRALLAARQPFRDVVMWRTSNDGNLLYMTVSGEPLLHNAGRFLGYRGVGKNITERKREEQLLRLEHTVTRCLAEGNSVSETLKSVLHIICESEDWDCGRYFRVDEQADVLHLLEDWGIEDAAVKGYLAAAHQRTSFPPRGVKGGAWRTRGPVWGSDQTRELRMSAQHLGDGSAAFAFPVIAEGKALGVVAFNARKLREPDKRLLQAAGVIGSQIGQFVQRKSTEQFNLRLGRMFAALSATNDAILHAQSPEELYQQVCNAVVAGGKFSDAAIFLTNADATAMHVAADAGRAREGLRDAIISLDEASPQGRGLIGTAFRAQRPVISNDFLNDERTRPWHDVGRKLGWRAAAALPLLKGGRSIGAVLIHYAEANAFDDEILKLLERLAENISFALDNFEHESERRRAQERVQYLATHDDLTGLPNRVMFSQVLNLAIQSARRYERRFAVLFLDLDRFKIINDTLGHEAGDALLREMARRFKENLRSSDVVARLGGDEFVVLVQEVNEPEQVHVVARKLMSAVIKPVVILGQECRVTASVGISTYPADGQDEQTLMKNADIAMYLAKEEGKNNFQFYSKDIKAQSLERLSLEMSLRHALEREEFFLDYQAKLDLASGAISGVEALLRWRHPDLGLVSPAQFIPLAEETGLIVPIGKWVLNTACAQNMTWRRAGLPAVCMAVNLSPRQFADENLLTDLAAALDEAGLEPELLELEITESMVMGNVERAAKQLAAIKHMGVRLAIDDFGTGYSSLAQIKRFPIDTIKVDRSFIREIPDDAEDKAITQAIIAMGKTLSLTVVAEGVETEAQERFLREHACNEMQGYYFSRPTAPENFAELLRTHIPRPAA